MLRRSLTVALHVKGNELKAIGFYEIPTLFFLLSSQLLCYIILIRVVLWLDNWQSIAKSYGSHDIIFNLLI